MSVLGTGIAAGVSQTGLQAQQVAREADRKKAQDDEASRRVRERFEAHLRTLEDPEPTEPVDRIQVDDHPPQDQPADRKPAPGEVVDEQADDPVPDPGADSLDGEGRLYHHLDVKG